MKIFGFTWPLVLRRTLERRANDEWGAGHHSGYQLGLMNGDAGARAALKTYFEHVQRMIHDLSLHQSDPRTNSDALTIQFSKLLKEIQGDEAYARFVIEQTDKALWAIFHAHRH